LVLVSMDIDLATDLSALPPLVASETLRNE